VSFTILCTHYQSQIIKTLLNIPSPMIRDLLHQNITKEIILKEIHRLTSHPYIEITLRGNAAITAALSVVPKGSTILIPEEGGWIHYEKAPPQLGLKAVKVSCDDARINLDDLTTKLTELKPSAFLYQNPGGYFAQQPMTEIYDICKRNNCLVIMDVSGSIGTSLCDGSYADFLVCSFGEEKLVEAKIGGFISSPDERLLHQATVGIDHLDQDELLNSILKEIRNLPERIRFLTQKRKKVIADLKQFDVVHKEDMGFVVVIKFSDTDEKNKIIEYCKKEKLEYTECPRYIRLNSPAISIEVKRLESEIL